MKRSKKIFVVVAVLFFIVILIVGYDISRKTSFPGSKKYLKESILPSEPNENEPKDEEEVQGDSTGVDQNPEKQN